MFFLGVDQGIKMNSERLISTDQHIFTDTKEAWLRFLSFDPCTIKPSRVLEGNDEAIKDDFHQSSSLIPVANTSTVDTVYTSDYLTP